METLVVIGVGGMGETIARRLASGRTTVLADYNIELLDGLAASMTTDGFEVVTVQVDVSSRASVEALAQQAASLGPIMTVIHTAGVSPMQASIDRVLKVDLLGTALVLEAFGAVVASGGAGVVISSSSAYLTPAFTPEQAYLIRNAAPEGLLDLAFFSPGALGDSGIAYGLAKQANRIQVQNSAAGWGARGARINSVSPGVISTAMGRLELSSPWGGYMREMVEKSGTGRFGTPSDIADAVTFLVGPQATFVTGIDLLVDGGCVAAVATGRVTRPGG